MLPSRLWNSAESTSDGSWLLCSNGVAIPFLMRTSPPLSVNRFTVPSRAAIADLVRFVGRPSLVVNVVRFVFRSWSSPLAVPIHSVPSRSSSMERTLSSVRPSTDPKVENLSPAMRATPDLSVPAHRFPCASSSRVVNKPGAPRCAGPRLVPCSSTLCSPSPVAAQILCCRSS